MFDVVLAVVGTMLFFGLLGAAFWMASWAGFILCTHIDEMKAEKMERSLRGKRYGKKKTTR